MRKLNPTAKFILWFNECELGRPDDNDDCNVDDIIGDLDYVFTQEKHIFYMFLL